MEIVESCDRFPRLVSGSGGKVAVNLRVGIEKSFDTGRIYQVIAEIHRSDPEAEVQIRQASVPDLERGLREDHLHGADALKSPLYWTDGGGNNSTEFTWLPAGWSASVNCAASVLLCPNGSWHPPWWTGSSSCVLITDFLRTYSIMVKRWRN